jgi:SAM-dependent methyltransferase
VQAVFEITDEGAARRVRLRRPVHAMGRRVEHGERLVPYSTALLRDLEIAVGEYLWDELEREFEPGYLRARFERTLRNLGIGGGTVLDFGCGRGSSTLILSTLGFAQVTGTDINERSIGLARRRAAERGLPSRFTTALPDGPFDLVFCNAVLEHMTPEERARTVRDLWSRVAPGGHFLVQETPNRLFPIDRHTTGRPLVPWLPLPLKLRLAHRPGRTEAFRTGIHGVSMSDFDRWIPRPERIDRSREADPRLEALTVTGRARGTGASVAIGMLRVLIRALAGLTDRPAPHFYPYLLVCFRKRPDNP